MALPLSPQRLASARRTFNIFNLLNSFSYVFVSGSVITLFALRLGATNGVIGILNALVYVTFFMLPVGKRLVGRAGIVKLFGTGWIIRYLVLLPMIGSAWLAEKGFAFWALLIVVLSTAGFHIARGVALIGNNPVLGYLASGGSDKPRSDQGRFLVNVSVINSIAGIAASMILAGMLGEHASLWTYSLAIGIGVVTGLAGCVFLLKTPEPDAFGASEVSLWKVTMDALQKPEFRAFIFTFLLLSLLSGMGRAFLPVYARDVFNQGDDAIMVYSIVAGLGSIAMGLITRLVVDRLGSKPLFIIFSATGLVSFMPIAVLPGKSLLAAAPALVAFFLSFVHFLSSFGFAGEENAGQVYYFGLVPKEKMLDLAVVYNLAYGIGGSIGSLLGGIALESLAGARLGKTQAYQIYYAIITIALALVIYGMRNLPHLGAKTVSQSLAVLFSPRELKAFELMSRLDQSASAREEIRLLKELAKSRSRLSQSQLVAYMQSPRFEVRMEALLALETLEQLEPATINALLKEVENNAYTTAYIAARILGRHQVAAAVPVLLRALRVEDYMLQSTAMVALARMGAREAVPEIEQVIRASENPRVRISGAYALELLKAESALPTLLACLKATDRPAYVSDEIVLAIAGIYGVEEHFYGLYSEFIEDRKEGIVQLAAHSHDLDIPEDLRSAWKEALDLLFLDPCQAAPMARLLLNSGPMGGMELVLGDALLDPMLTYPGYRFLCSSITLHRLAVQH